MQCAQQKKSSRLKKVIHENKKKQIVTTGCFRDSTGGFCDLEFWPFSTSFSNKDVTRFDLILVLFFFETRKTLATLFIKTKVTNVK